MKLPETYEELHGLACALNDISKKYQNGRTYLNISLISQWKSEYKSKKPETSFIDYLLLERQRKFYENIYPQEKENLWLLVWSPNITKKIIVDKKQIDVPVIQKFKRHIIDINSLNQGWCGSYLEDMRKYIFMKGDENKRQMLESTLAYLEIIEKDSYW